jgi:hypothetical protein
MRVFKNVGMVEFKKKNVTWIFPQNIYRTWIKGLSHISSLILFLRGIP